MIVKKTRFVGISELPLIKHPRQLGMSAFHARVRGDAYKALSQSDDSNVSPEARPFKKV